MRNSYLEKDGADVAARGWFDPRSLRVLYVGQVVRAYDDESAASDFMTGARTTWADCKSWEQGPNPDAGFETHGRPFVPKPVRLGDETLGWREITGSGKFAASTFRFAVRRDGIISIVEATGPDDSERLVRLQVLRLAKSADRRIAALLRG
jgi:hypothetical protein